MSLEHMLRDEQEFYLAHLEDEFVFEHTVYGCQCIGKYCRICDKVLCIRAFYWNNGKINKPCKACRGKRQKMIREHPELKYKQPDLQTKFITKVDIRDGQCWLWKGHIDQLGYGVMDVDNHKMRAHRISYELYKGSIPEKFVVDHLCEVKHCVNPDHLESVSMEVNSSRVQGRRRQKRLSIWKELYRDLYIETHGNQVLESEWIADAVQRIERLGLPDPKIV